MNNELPPNRSLFHEDDYQPLPGVLTILGVITSLILIGVGIGWILWGLK
jgi:hypothetical protein